MFLLRGELQSESVLVTEHRRDGVQALMEQLSRIEAEQQRLLMIQTGGMPGIMGGMAMMGGPAMMPGAAPGELAARAAPPSFYSTVA